MKEEVKYIIESKRRDERKYDECRQIGFADRKLAIEIADKSTKLFSNLKYRVIDQRRKVIKIFK